MSLFALFDIGRSGITASQRALAVASNNIANVNTPGYSRQEVILKVANPIEINGDFVGRGVGDTDIRRNFDNFTYLQILNQSSSYGEAYALESGLNHVEQIFNEAQEMGLLNYMQSYFNAWQNVSNNADSSSARTTLLREAEAFVNAVKHMETDLKNTLDFVNDEVGDVVGQINVLTTNIASVNGKVQQIEAGGSASATTFRDERERLMKDLAKLVDFDWNEDTDGSVTIVAGRRSIVAGVESFDLSTSLKLNGDRDVYSGGINITDYIQKGKLGGFIELRDDINDNALVGLRTLVSSITIETNGIHDSGFGLNDSTGGNDFFSALQLYARDDTDGGSNASIGVPTIFGGGDSSLLTLTEYDIDFTDASTYNILNHETGAIIASAQAFTSGADIDINSEITAVITGVGANAPAAGDTFFISPNFRSIENFSVSITDPDGIAASSLSTAAGANRSNNVQANLIVAMQGANITDLGGISFEEYYGAIVSDVASLSKAVSDNLEFEDNLLFELENRRESVSGVSLDEEAANLIRYQRAFEAGARIIQITDELLELVINL